MENDILSFINRLKEHCHLGKHKNFFAADRFKAYETRISLSMMFINLIIAVAHLVTIHSEMPEQIIYIISGLSIFAVFLAGFELRSDYSRKFVAHRRIGNQYLSLETEIEQYIALISDGMKYNYEELIKELSSRYNKINEEAEDFPTNKSDFDKAKSTRKSKRSLYSLGFTSLVILGLIFFVIYEKNYCINGFGQKETNKINIAAVLPLTGTSANIGKWQKQGIELAVEKYNTLHSNERKVSVKFEDSQSDPKFGLSAFEKLNTYNDNSGYLFSLSSVANAVIPQLNKNPKPSMLLAVSLPKITDKSDYVYRFHLGSEDEAIAMSEYMLKNEYNSIAVVYLNDEFGVGALEVFKEKFESKGGHIASVETYTKDQTDFKSIITKINSLKPQGVYVIGYVQASVIFIKQMRELGFSKQVFANMALSVPSFIKTGGEALDGAIYTVTSFNANDENKIVNEFVKEYKNNYREAPTFFSGFAFDATNILIQNITQSKVPEKQISIHTENYSGVMGKVNVNSNRNFQFPIKIVRNDSGEIVDGAQ